MNSLGRSARSWSGRSSATARERGAFCMNSGFRGAIEGDWTKLKALALAVAVQLLLLPAIFATRLARPAELPLLPSGRGRRRPALRVLDALGRRLRGGRLVQAGRGRRGALLAILGMALGALASDSGPLAGVRLSLQQAVPKRGPVEAAVPRLRRVGILLLAVLTRLNPGRAGAWSWQRPGCGSASWLPSLGLSPRQPDATSASRSCPARRAPFSRSRGTHFPHGTHCWCWVSCSVAGWLRDRASRPRPTRPAVSRAR